MNKDRIFLSYRRDDSPGYVSRLEHELEGVFGKGCVFRDTSDILGGAKWKKVIDENLHRSAVLLLVIGPRWETIWVKRIHDDINYVALELQRAYELDVPIIPVTLDGTNLSEGFDLGEINFIYDNQFHDISDKQDRWEGDLSRLVSAISTVSGMVPTATQSQATPTESDSGSHNAHKWIAIAAVAAVVVFAAFKLSITGEPDEPVIGAGNPVGSPVGQSTGSTTGSGATPTPTAEPDAQYLESVPMIAGIWEGRNGTRYEITQFDDGTFNVESTGYGSGQGRFFTHLPRKFAMELKGMGQGEFSVSATGDKIMGRMIIDGQMQQHDTLLRVD